MVNTAQKIREVDKLVKLDTDLLEFVGREVNELDCELLTVSIRR